MKTIVALIAIGLTLTGCGANAEPSPAADTTPAMPADHPQMTGGDQPPMPGGAGTLTGKVAEAIDGGGYTYIKIANAEGETWAAVPKTEVNEGDEVTVQVQMAMNDFESTAINRTFDTLVFATIGAGPGASPHGGSGMGMPMVPGHGAKADLDLDSIAVEKAQADNARTVAELWAEREALRDSSVVIRGKVVKFLPSIMGRNWVHLRDGTGTAEAADNDITITTSATVQVGDVVVATGVVRVDKDLGAGYSYPVILEEGTFTN